MNNEWVFQELWLKRWPNLNSQTNISFLMWEYFNKGIPNRSLQQETENFLLEEFQKAYKEERTLSWEPWRFFKLELQLILHKNFPDSKFGWEPSKQRHRWGRSERLEPGSCCQGAQTYFSSLPPRELFESIVLLHSAWDLQQWLVQGLQFSSGKQSCLTLHDPWTTTPGHTVIFLLMKFPVYSTNYILCSLFKGHVNTIPLFLLSSGNGNRQCLFISISSASQCVWLFAS